MSFFSRFYDFEKFPGIPREKFPNSQFFPFPWEKNLGGKTETLLLCVHRNPTKHVIISQGKKNLVEEIFFQFLMRFTLIAVQGEMLIEIQLLS